MMRFAAHGSWRCRIHRTPYDQGTSANQQDGPRMAVVKPKQPVLVDEPPSPEKEQPYGGAAVSSAPAVVRRPVTEARQTQQHEHPGPERHIQVHAPPVETIEQQQQADDHQDDAENGPSVTLVRPADASRGRRDVHA